MQQTLDIVIVNWNAGPALAECLTSTTRASRALPGTRVVVVDNGSTDTSLADALAVAPSTVTLRNTANVGFASACNQGARGSAADYLLFLNPDTALSDDSLERVLAFMAGPDASAVGICGARLVDARGRPASSAGRFPTARVFLGLATGLWRVAPGIFPRPLLSAADLRATGDVDHVLGAFFMIRRELFTRLGGFDERFFLYFEEIDLAYRARHAGARSVHVAEAVVRHVGQASTDQVKAARLFYTWRSRILYAEKHCSKFGAWLTRASILFVEHPIRTGRAWFLGGGNAAETAEACVRLRAFLATPGWRHSLEAQRRPWDDASLTTRTDSPLRTNTARDR